jgi:hypothetical protein
MMNGKMDGQTVEQFGKIFEAFTVNLIVTFNKHYLRRQSVGRLLNLSCIRGTDVS